MTKEERTKIIQWLVKHSNGAYTFAALQALTNEQLLEHAKWCGYKG